MLAGITASQAQFQGIPIPEGLFLVGSKIVGTGSSVAFDFTGLTGGDIPATEPEIGDFILLMGSRASAGASGGTLTVVPAGFSGTSTANSQGSDTIDANARMWHGFYEAGSVTGGTYDISGGAGPTGHMTIFVFRNADPTTPLDVTPTTIARTNGCDITLVSITPVTAGSIIVCFASSGSESGSNTYFDPPTITDIVKAGRGSTNDNSAIVGLNRDWVSGPFAPGLFDFDGGNSLSSAASMSIVVRPAP